MGYPSARSKLHNWASGCKILAILCQEQNGAVLAAWRRIMLQTMMHWLIFHLCAARVSGLARNGAAAALASDAAAVQRGTPGYEALLEKNWVGNVQFNSAAAIVPASLEELRTAVRAARAPVRVVGRGHSFTPVAECKGGTLLSLARLNRVLDFREPTADRLGSITIEGGVT